MLMKFPPNCWKQKSYRYCHAYVSFNHECPSQAASCIVGLTLAVNLGPRGQPEGGAGVASPLPPMGDASVPTPLSPSPAPTNVTICPKNLLLGGGAGVARHGGKQKNRESANDI